MRRRHVLDAGQLLHEVVDRREAAVDRVLEDEVEPAFLGLAGIHEAADVERLLHGRVDRRQHGERAGDVEAADADGDTGLAQGPRDIERARELVRLHADEHDHAPACLGDPLRDTVRAHPRVGLVDRLDVERVIGREHVASLRIESEAVQARQANSPGSASVAIG